MMENRYKILWLDDDFAEEDADQTKAETDNREIFQDDVEAASDWGFDVVGVKNLEEFKREMANIGAYQAVVFDLRGMMAEGSPDEYVAHDAIDLLERTHKLPKYIYSGNTNMPQHEGMLRRFIKNGRVFNKGNGVDALYDKIKDDLEESLHFYEDHRECLQLFQRGFLDDMENRLVMDEILRRHKEKDLTYSPYNAMRHILEDMTNSFSHYLDKNEGFLTKDESVRLYNGLMQSATYDAFFIVMRWYYNYMSRTQ